LLEYKQRVISREEVLQTIDWTQKKKDKVQMALTLDYMSSEDSAEEEEGVGGKRAIFKVRELPWERKELREAKRSLDSSYLSNLSRRALYKRYKRARAPESSLC
jgi:hypothetical protein